MFIVRNDPNLDTTPLLHLQIGNVVSGVFGGRRQHHIPGLQWQGVERHIPCAGRVLDHRNFIRLGVDQTADGAIHVFQVGRLPSGSFIAAETRFKLNMTGHRLDHRRGHQRRAGIVEVDQLRDGGGVGAQLFNVQKQTP
ncbi:hypothetical protein D3C81_1323800 [compost metagenome]